MNEEIEKITKEYRDMILGDFKTVEEQQEWIRQRLEQAYLLGAKDMMEAVKIEEEQPDLTGNLTISDIANIAGYSRGFSGAVRATNLKAQQFIDSLEKESSHS